MEQPQINKLTIEDYWGLPEDGKRYEILEGMLEVTPSPLVEHQNVVGNLFGLLWTFLQSSPCGKVLQAPMDVILSDETVCQPDLLFVRSSRASEVIQDRVRGAPDLVVEVLSPATAARDLSTKKQIYARHRVSEYWIVDPRAQSLQRLVLRDLAYAPPDLLRPGDVLRTPLMPGLELAVSRLFANP